MLARSFEQPVGNRDVGRVVDAPEDRPPGYADPSEAIAAIQPGMLVLLELIGEIAADSARSGPAEAGAGGRLDRQLRQWSSVRELDAAPGTGGEQSAPPPAVLRLGVLTWTRVHGIVTLELAGILDDMGLDAGLLVEAELDGVVAAAAGG